MKFPNLKASVFIVSLIILTLSCYSQDTATVKTLSKFSLGIVFSPQIAYRSNSAIDKGKENSFLVDFSLPLIDSIESKKFGYSVGLNFMYKISRRFTIRSGVLYANKGYENNELIATNASGFNIFSNGSKSHIIYNYNYIDIPVGVNFYLIDKRIKLFLSGGIVNDVFVNQKINMKVDNEERIFTTTDGYVKYNISWLLGIGAEYHLSNRFYISLEPQYQRFFNTILKPSISDNQYKTILYSYGVQTGVYYKF